MQAFQQAVAFHDQGRLWEAERLYAIVLDADRRHFGSLCRLGVIRLQQGRFDDAARMLRRSLKVDGNSADAHHSLACALTGLGRSEEAVRHYQRALALRPDFPEAHNNLGHELQVLGRYEQAIAHYEKALAIRPDYAEARNNLGNALHVLDRSEEAIAHYQKALAIRPDYAEAHWNLGNALRELRRTEEAIAHYGKALAIRPNYAEAHNSLGNALHMLDRSEEAMAQYEKALAIGPAHAETHLNLSVTLGDLGRREEAIAHYNEALAISPDYFDALDNRANALKILHGLASLPESIISIASLLAHLDKVAATETEEADGFGNLAAFTRAAMLDKAGRHAEAWECLVPANRAPFVSRQEEFAELTARQSANIARLRENQAKIAGSADDRGTISLFILGASRSGKTTMERLVSTLPGIKRGFENLIVEEAAERACETSALPASTRFEDLPPALYPLCRDLYLGELAAHAGSAKVFTHTNPTRIYYADLMAQAFPNVRFVFLKRDLEDNVLRIYLKRYRRGNIYGYDLKAARDHVVWYHKMMDLLAEKLPAIVRVIRYEDMVADPTAALGAAADLCGLPRVNGPVRALGDDRGCAAPYRSFMAAELGS